MGSVQLPEDILRQIFVQLDVYDVLTCRAVCRAWRDAVDCLSDGDWKKICANDKFYMDYVAIQKKSGLSWRETIRAAHSWDVDTKNMKVSKLCSNIEHFKVLYNGRIACMTHRNTYSNNRTDSRSSSEDSVSQMYCDTIMFYNAETSQLIEEQHFDFKFYASTYDENEYLQVLAVKQNEDDEYSSEEDEINLYRFCGVRDWRDRLNIIVKNTKKRFFVGYCNSAGGFLEATLIGKALYFKEETEDVPRPVERIRCSKLNENDIIETNVLGTAVHDPFLDVSINFIDLFFLIGEDLYYLADHRRTNLCIYRYEKPVFICIYKFRGDNLFEEVDSFADRENEFHYLARKIGRAPIINYLYEMITGNSMDLYKSIFYTNGIVLFWCSDLENDFHIYNIAEVSEHNDLPVMWDDYQLENEYDGYTRTSIKMKDILPHVIDEMKLDLINTASSHKILMFTGNKLYILDLPYGGQKTNNVRKRQAEETKPNHPKKVAIKKESTITNVPHKHGYATRSSTKL